MRARSLQLVTVLAVCQAALAPGASAGIGFTCRFDAVAAVVRIDIVWDDVSVNVRREARGSGIVVGGGGCHGATVRNVDRIRVVGAPGLQSLVIDLSNGPLGPGKTPEGTRVSEIEISFEGGLGHDIVSIRGSPGPDVIRVSGAGAALGGDSDTDAWWWGVEQVSAAGGHGPDRLRAAGARGVPFEGGVGADVLIGSTGRDALDGGRGPDHLFGAEGNDRLVAGAGGDRVSAGAGRDQLYIRDGRQERSIDCGPGDDVLRTSDRRDREIAAGCELAAPA